MLPQFFRAYAPWLALGAGVFFLGVTVIVFIYAQHASAPNANGQGTPIATDVPVPDVLAKKLQGPAADAEAFDTPFFNAAKEPLTLAEQSGRGLVVNFWATWCAPCVKEMPALDSLAVKLKGRGVDVLAVSQDRRARVVVPMFYAKQGIENLDLYYDEQNRLGGRMDVNGLPTTILIDAAGNEVGRVLGILEWDDDAVVSFLAERLAPRDEAARNPQ